MVPPASPVLEGHLEYGAHNQRCTSMNVKVDGGMWLEDLIEIAEQEASCELWGVLKLEDEKYVTERAYENPKFVEDLVRDVAAHCRSRVRAYSVESEDFESIHNHSACAHIDVDKDAWSLVGPESNPRPSDYESDTTSC